MGCTRSTSVAPLLPSPTHLVPWRRYLNKTAQNFALVERHQMPLVCLASHHVCAAAAVGVHWLTSRWAEVPKIRQQVFSRSQHRIQQALHGGVIAHLQVL